MPNNTDPARALGYTPGRLDETAPERIWLQIDTAGNNADRDLPFPDADGVTWEQDSVGGLEIQYVRADLASAPQQPAGVEAHYHPCTSILIEGLKRLDGGDAVLAEWDRARAKADTALAQQPAASGEAVGSDGRRERLLERRNVLNNSFGNGAYEDGRVQQQIDAIDAELAALAAPQQPAAPSGEAVARVNFIGGVASVEWLAPNLVATVRHGTKLYTAPQQPAAPSGEAVAWLRMKPDGTPEPLYAAPQQPAGVGGAPQAWISDNDLLKLHESVDEARNIRMSVRRTHTRVHPIYIPALAALQGGRDDG